MILKYHFILILITFVVQTSAESTVNVDNEYEDYEYDDIKQQKVNSVASQSEKEIRNLQDKSLQEANSREEESSLESDRQEKNRNESDRQEKDQQVRDRQEKDQQVRDRQEKDRDEKNQDKTEDQIEKNVDYVDERYEDKLNEKYDDISKYQNLKYENDKNYGTVRKNTYELIDDEEEENDENARNDSDDVNNDDQSLKEPKEQIRFVTNSRFKPKVKKAQVKLIKEMKHPKLIVSRPKYYYPGRNFVHQRSSRKDAKLSKIKMKSNKFANDDLSTLIPLELYKRQVRSRFVSSGEYLDARDGRSSRLMDGLEVPRILNGELYCDCGFYLKLKNRKINKLSSKLKKVSNEQRQMKRKLIEMAVKENQLQLICRSQSKANLKYISNGKPAYLALSNATAQSNPIDLI